MLVSIFNDVIGPVMRGPSSSHCAAALRIGRLARDLMGGALQEVRVEFDRQGALATTHASQGSDMGLCGGLLGWEADNERLPGAVEALRQAGINLRVDLVDGRDAHPNTYRLTLRNAQEQHALVAISTGGGMVEIIAVDGFTVSIAGDYHETLLRVERGGPEVIARLAALFAADEVLLHAVPAGQLVEVKAQQFIPADVLERLQAVTPLRGVQCLAPVLPVLSRRGLQVPFTTCADLLRHAAGRNVLLWQLAVEYEAARGGLSAAEVVSRMTALVRIVRRSIQQGLAGTHYADRLLGRQSDAFQARMAAGRLLAAGVLNRTILYVTALMEVKSALGVIVAAPTAGSCAALPGACVAVAEELGLPEEAMARAMLAGGLIGAFIATRSTFAAEVAGCQAECGAAGAMAAAALVTLAEGTLSQALAAAALALQSALGMVCDPVANRVEVPCLGKNVLAASNALACANMALADYDPVIPLDEVIETADRVGRSLPRELRCTALGGLSITKTSLELERKLAEQGRSGKR